MHLIRFDQVTLEFGDQVILKNAGFTLDSQERVCLIGRNGAGKSTLFRLIAGDIEPDAGDIIRRSTLQISQLVQTLPQQLEQTVSEYVLAGLSEQKMRIEQYRTASRQTSNPAALRTLQQLQQQIEAHGGWNIETQAQATMSDLQLPPDLSLTQLSGGWQRRVSLARALVSQPDLLLLDEPTNHLDINTIQWLEQRVKNYSGCVLFITHDRAFLQSLATRIVEIDRGKLVSWPGNYVKYLEYKKQSRENEKRHNQLFDKKLAQEETWIRQGIKARRTRNEGRVRALESMREERAERIEPESAVQLSISQAETSGKSVISVKNLRFAFDDRIIVENLTLKIRRGDRIGLVGNNGVGKSTLLKLLLGELNPHSGTVKLGTNLQPGYFDQLRYPLDPNKTIADVIGEGSEYITINGKQRHVVGYLKGFLFSPKRALSPVKILSGGERNRVILAKLFSKPSNLLVLDEPTNDLDVETLEVLEEQLQEYTGTLIVVSHDRKFLDKTVKNLLVFEDSGKIEAYEGGFSDWLVRGRKLAVMDRPQSTDSANTDHAPHGKRPAPPTKLSYKLKLELERLPSTIEDLEQTLTRLQSQINTQGFYDRPFDEIDPILQALKTTEAQLDIATQRWIELEDLQNSFSNSTS